MRNDANTPEQLLTWRMKEFFDSSVVGIVGTNRFEAPL